MYGSMVLSRNRKGYLNRLFFFGAVFVAFRSLCEGEMRSAGSLSEAVFWANASFTRVIALALLLHFVLYYTGFWHSLNRFVAWVIVYLPAIVFSCMYLVTYDKQQMLVHTRYGWMFDTLFPTLISQVHLIWALLLGVTVIGLLWVYYSKTTGEERNKIHAISIFLTHVVLAVITVSLLKRFYVIDLFFFNGIVTLTAAIFLGFLVWRYPLILTPALIVDEILSSMEDGLIITDNDGTLIKVNTAVLRLTGYTEKELHRKPATLLLPNRISNHSPGERADTGETAFSSFESVITTKTGTDIPVRFAMTTVKQRKRGRAARIFLFRDLTPYKAIEGELQKAQRLETFELLMRSIIHDFNNLLCSISVRLSMCDSDETLSDKIRLNLKTTNQTALLAADLIKQFGAFLKHTSIDKIPCNLATIIKESASMVQCDGKAFIIIDDLDTLPQIKGISQQLMQVFLNLFINGRQAMDDNGKVFVSGECSEKGDEVTIIIKDNGYGMSQEMANRIFQPFYTTKKSGSGLGLAIVANIIKSHQGSISVSSIEGTGTIFTITLPVSGGTDQTLNEQADFAASMHS